MASLEEKIDTSSAAGELVFHVFGAIAHFERRLIAERTRDGLAAAAANGRRPGRKPLDPEKLEAALALVAAGLSSTRAAFQVGIGPVSITRFSKSAPLESTDRVNAHRLLFGIDAGEPSRYGNPW